MGCIDPYSKPEKRINGFQIKVCMGCIDPHSKSEKRINGFQLIPLIKCRGSWLSTHSTYKMKRILAFNPFHESKPNNQQQISNRILIQVPKTHLRTLNRLAIPSENQVFRMTFEHYSVDACVKSVRKMSVSM